MKRDHQLVGLPKPAELAPYYRDRLAHERNDDYWRQWNVSDHYAGCRTSTEKAEPIKPGEIYQYKIDLWATSDILRPSRCRSFREDKKR